ncbi:hypothetical protein PENSPDRAFT_653881 [Peniophora sp. CONT]|nr:hypothetical protein PENSPDRAFT_653881 [Peniophora sp. CONT]
MPGLWAMHIGILLEAMPVFLERAGENVPLHVYIELGNLDPVHSERFDLLLLRDLIIRDRIGEFTLSTAKKDTIEHLRASLISAPSPSLKSLDLQYISRITCLSGSHAQLDGCSAILPYGETISLDNCFISFAAPALTNLSLKRIGMPCSYLLEILSQTTKLERLNVIY